MAASALLRLGAACPARWRRPAAALAARLALVLRASPASITATNLELCFPELSASERADLCLASLTETALLGMETGALLRHDVDRLDDLVVGTEGLELLEAALAEGKGVLLLVPHYGNWEFLALFLGRYDLLALYEAPRWAALDAALRAARERGGARMLPIGRGSLRSLYRTLEAGGLAALLPDQVPARAAGLHVPFFGRSALTMTLAHRLLERTGAVALLGAARRRAHGYQITIRPVADAVAASDPETALAAMNQGIEALVREDPAQYQWEYRRFRRPPPGQPSPYAKSPRR